MMNIMIISSSKAEHILALWNNPTLNIIWMVFSLIALLCFGLGLLGTLAVFMDFKRTKTILPIALALLLIGCLLGVKTIHNAKVANTNYETTNNVIDYHKMQHLRKIYPKLPCKPYIKYKTCNYNSLSKVSKNKRIANHTLTRHTAVKKYNHYHSMITGGNGTKSMHPHTLRWDNYI